MDTIKEEVLKNRLCIGCGLCAARCPENAIDMTWDKKLMWVPQINDKVCTRCGQCVMVCPNTPEMISSYAVKAAEEKECFGLPGDAHYVLGYDLDIRRRIRSASGGLLNALLRYLLANRMVDGVIASVPVKARLKEEHYKLKIITSLEDLDKSRSSHYCPLRYDEILSEVSRLSGRYVFVGVPCVIRGIKKFPKDIQGKFSYLISLACSHNVTGALVDCLARQEGILDGESFWANLRDKSGGIPDAGSYNSCFCLKDRDIRKNRHKSSYAFMWRSYFFAHECCLHCPDFFGADADISVKDAWHTVQDPLGKSLAIIRNEQLANSLKQLQNTGKLFLESCPRESVVKANAGVARLKHVDIRDRMVWSSAVRKKLKQKEYFLGTSRRWWKRESIRFWQVCATLRSTVFFYAFSERWVVYSISVYYRILISFRKLFGGIKEALKGILYPIVNTGFLFLCYPITMPRKVVQDEKMRVLISGGYGYQNIGDEAQLAHVLSLWKDFCPNVQPKVFSPNPQYTEKTHNVSSQRAPRVVFFYSSTRSHYAQSNIWFKWNYLWMKPRILAAAWLQHKKLPLIGISPDESRLLNSIAEADVLHLSGGGYLTGMTLSRLWDNMLLIKIADILGTPVILSGQTIGVFRGLYNRRLSRWGLSKAKLIYLRDKKGSQEDVESLGIAGDRIKSTFDDALFCAIASQKDIDECLKANGREKNKYIVLNVHYWGQKKTESSKIMNRIAKTCDDIVAKYRLPVVFIPMHPSDVPAIREVQIAMNADSRLIEHGYDFRLAKGVISYAELCITMKHHAIVFALGSGVPSISIVLDDYYIRKNKGTLSIFDQEKMICGRNDLFSEGLMEKVDYCIKNQEFLKNNIMSKLKDLQGQDGEAIKRFLKEFYRKNRE